MNKTAPNKVKHKLRYVTAGTHGHTFGNGRERGRSEERESVCTGFSPRSACFPFLFREV